MPRETGGPSPAEREQSKTVKLSKRSIFVLPAFGGSGMSGEGLFSPEAFENAAKDREKNEYYWNMLVRYVHESGFIPPPGRGVRILELGCGVAPRAQVLRNFLSGADYPLDDRYDIQAEYVGIDNDSAAIERAKERNKVWVDWNKPARLPEGMKFISADATDLSETEGVPAEVDFVMIQHPRTVEEAHFVDWQKIFNEGLSRLSESGILLATFYAESELENFKRAVLPHLDAVVVLQDQRNVEQNPKVDVPDVKSESGYNYDNFVIVLAKKKVDSDAK
jgi:hypothetical protein